MDCNTPKLYNILYFSKLFGHLSHFLLLLLKLSLSNVLLLQTKTVCVRYNLEETFLPYGERVEALT